MFQFQWKRLYTNKAILISFLLYIIYVGYLVWTNYYPTTPDLLVMTIMMQMPLTFLFFECTAFSFFSKTTADVREIGLGSGQGIHKDYLSGILIFGFIDLLVVLIFGGLWFLCISKGDMPVNSAYFVMLIKMLFTYHFLTYFFAILLGCAISFVKKRSKAYLILMGSFFAFSDNFLRMIGSIWERYPNLQKMPIFFSILNRDWRNTLDGYYQYSVEAVNVERILFWILLVALILAACISRKQKRLWVGICGVSLLVVTILFVQPAGYYYEDSFGSSWLDDTVYYQSLEKDITGRDDHVSEADFTIKKYAGNLTVNRELQAEIEVYMDEKNHDKYEFTLYHGFQVSTILDGEKELEFEQKGDHITIHSPGGLKQKAVTFVYHGYSNFYYSTSQATFLPGYFCYLPFPGHRLVWLKEELMENGMYDASKEDDLSGIGYEVEYDLKVDLAQKVYSNISVDEQGNCQGKSDGLTLLASPYMVSQKEQGVTFLYPLCRQGEYMLDDLFKETATELVKDGRKGITVFVPPYSNRMMFFVGKDHVVLEPEFLEDHYIKYRETGEIPYPKAEEIDYDYD